MSNWLKNFSITPFLCIVACLAYGQREGSVKVIVAFEPVQAIVLHPVREENAHASRLPLEGVRYEAAHQDRLTIFSTSTYEIKVDATESYVYVENGDQKIGTSHFDVDVFSSNQPGPDIPDAYQAFTYGARYESTDRSRVIPPHSGQAGVLSSTDLLYTLSTK